MPALGARLEVPAAADITFRSQLVALELRASLSRGRERGRESRLLSGWTRPSSWTGAQDRPRGVPRQHSRHVAGTLDVSNPASILEVSNQAQSVQGVRGGSGICEHGRERSRCKECGGSGKYASMDGSATIVRSAAARASASTGVSAPGARSAAAAAFAITGGGASDARTAVAAASASTG